MPEPPTPTIAFRPLALADLAAMAAWLADPDVARWYREGAPTVARLTEKYRPLIDGTEPTRAYIIQVDGRGIGYIQAYLIADHPEYARQIAMPPGAAGIDLFIGDAGVRNRGLGAPILRAFVAEIVFGELGADLAVIAPEPANQRAIRAYVKAGFHWLKTVYIDDPDPDNRGEEFVMVQARAGSPSPRG